MNCKSVNFYLHRYNGVYCQIPKNICLAFSSFTLFTAMSPTTFLLKEISFNTLIYPIITVMRRMETQSKRIGMIPRRYLSARHCLGLMYREEGLKGLYRGYSSFLVGK